MFNKFRSTLAVFQGGRAYKYIFAGTDLIPVLIHGGVQVSHHTEQLKSGCHILVATLGRLKGFIESQRVCFNLFIYIYVAFPHWESK